MDDEQGAAPRGHRHATAWLGVVLVLSMAARLPAMRFPLDQDSAVYSYVAETWLDGGLPYRDAWDHKPPFIYLIYAGLFSLAEVSATTLRVASALCDAGMVVLVFLIARRLFGAAAGLWAALLCGLFTAAPGVQFEAFQPEHVMVLFVTASMLAALAYARSQKLRYAAVCGILFGLGLAAKQTAAPLGIFVWLWLTWEALRRDGSKAQARVVAHSLLLLVGVLLPWALFAAYFRWQGQGAFEDFWFCTYTYNAHYAVEDRPASFVAGSISLLKSTAPKHAFLWLTGLAGLAAVLARGRWRGGIVVGAWAACAFLSVLIPGQASPYYFIQTLVPLSILGGVTMAGLRQSVRKRGLLDAGNVLAALLLLALLALAARRELAHYRYASDPGTGNAVAVEIGRYLEARTRRGDLLYVWGSRPQIYVTSRRESVCPYLYNFSYNMVLDATAACGEDERPPTYHFRREKLDSIMAALEEHPPRFIITTEEKTLAKFKALRKLLDTNYTLQSRDDFKHEWPTSDEHIARFRVYRWNPR